MSALQQKLRESVWPDIERDKRFRETNWFCDKDINKFCLMLQKGFYP